MTTPAAAPAAPAAAAPATPPAAPAAPVAPAAPAAPTSLLDAAAAPAAPVAPAAPAAAETEWFYANGVKGVGAVPEWYKSTKYKSVDEQAKAYGELEKRFGSFTGAPADGKYAFKMPEDLTGEFDPADPLFTGFQKWAVDHHLNQEGYQELMGMYATAIAAQAVDMAQIKTALGDKADDRINAVKTWVGANLDAATQAKFKAATSDANAAAVFEAVEAVIAKTVQPKLPGPGDTNPGVNAGKTPSQLIRLEMEKKDAEGRVLYFDPSPAGQAHRARIEKMRVEAQVAGEQA